MIRDTDIRFNEKVIQFLGQGGGMGTGMRMKMGMMMNILKSKYLQKGEKLIKKKMFKKLTGFTRYPFFYLSHPSYPFYRYIVDPLLA